MSRARNPFRPGVTLAVLTAGAGAFLLFLFAIGQGWSGSNDRNGGEHAASNGLTGFAALAAMLENKGHEVILSRSPGGQDEYGLLVLTPPHFGNVDDLAEIIESRRKTDSGPTLVILPKWLASPVPEQADIEAEKGWVLLTSASSPSWFNTLKFGEGGALAIGKTKGWSGLGMGGPLPDPTQVQALTTQPTNEMRARILDSQGDILVAQLPPFSTIDQGYEPYPTIVVFEPDLMNNFGMADKGRARLALTLVENAMQGHADMPIYFDLTLAGLGTSENLLTLAFRPPFLAATLCLLLAALIIAWRAFRRFGPPVAEAPAMAQGKRQLARNGAALVARVKRFHLLADPYAALMGKRIADALGINETNPEARTAAIERALERRNVEGPGFARLASELKAASRPGDIIRAASALKSLERTLKR
ncbi:MAG: DUF4350 domain-containing protein [Alteraurantiacibacter sp. bin_em_oilr2.035]|nr:DUF4350 domain-containing protein [Alteraurantiacibacter sp. bin_em_oilr2.035]